jgi:hypothetical protein
MDCEAFESASQREAVRSVDAAWSRAQAVSVTSHCVGGSQP